jgi:hypothetical protein
MFKVNKFKNGKNNYVTETITIDKVLSIIKNGDDNLKKINEARAIGKGNPSFDDVKMSLPSFRFNFKFHTKVSNANIISSTGLIYIDVDDCDSIDLTNKYIFAAWKSISTTGFGILVKVNGLGLNNYSDTYNAISIELGLKTDVGARKATQQTILSYDPNLFHNDNSLVFKAINKSIIQSYTERREERKLIVLKDTFIKSDKIRFDNVSDYFIDNESEFITFNDEKEKLCQPFIPKRIEIGKRNMIMFGVLSQMALLNPDTGAKWLKAIANTINDKFVVKYSDEKINSIVGAVITKRENNTLEPYFNKERRIIFNPKIKITAKEKRIITAKEMGRIKTDKTKNEIYSTIEGWDFNEKGIINQEKVSSILAKSIVTIKRNWSDVKDLVKSMNQDYKNGIKSYTEANTDVLSNDNTNNISEYILNENDRLKDEFEGMSFEQLVPQKALNKVIIEEIEEIKEETEDDLMAAFFATKQKKLNY